jgi:hypothetical protein
MPNWISLIRLNHMGRENIDLDECPRSYHVCTRRQAGQVWEGRVLTPLDSLVEYWTTADGRGIRRDWRPDPHGVEYEEGAPCREVYPVEIAWMIWRFSVPFGDPLPPEFEECRSLLLRGLELGETIWAWRMADLKRRGFERVKADRMKPWGISRDRLENMALRAVKRGKIEPDYQIIDGKVRELWARLRV